MPRRALKWTQRLGIALVSCVLGATAPGTAHAAIPDLDLWVVGSTALGGFGSPGKVIEVMVHGTDAVDASLTIDTTNLRRVALLLPRTNACVAESTGFRCPLAGPGVIAAIPFDVKPTAAAINGSSANLTLTLTATGMAAKTTRTKFTFTDGVDLVTTTPSSPIATAKPGDTVYAKASFGNAGNRTASDTSFEFTFDADLNPVRYAGCTYTTLGQIVRVSCPVGRTLAPNEEVVFRTVTDDGKEIDGYRVKIEDDALDLKEVTHFARSAGVDLPKPLRKLSKTATNGKKYVAAPVGQIRAQAATEIDSSDNWGNAFWRVANQRDVAALGDTANGAVGDVVRVTVGSKNVGRGSIDASHTVGTPHWYFTFAVPEGTEVVAPVPANCGALEPSPPTYRIDPVPGRQLYICVHPDPYFAAGSTFAAEFALKITQVVPDATGTVSFQNRYADPQLPPTDANPANDTAKVIVNPTAAPSPSPTTTAPVLPVTGSQAGALAAGGAALLGVGIALFVASRRRRIRLLTPDGRTVD